MRLMTCEAKCERCYFNGGRRQKFDDNDLLFYCQSCKRVYFCEIGLIKANLTEYSCPHCTYFLLKEEVDKLIIDKKGNPKTLKSTESYEIYQKLRGEQKIDEKQPKQKRGAPEISTYILSQISELSDVQGLTIPLIKEYLQRINASSLLEIKNNSTIKKFLTELAQKDEKLIEFLFNTIFQFESKNDNPLSFELRFAIFCKNHLTSQYHVNFSNSSMYYDFKLVDSEKREIWIYCLYEDIDINNLDKLVKKASKVNFDSYIHIRKIFLVAKSYSFMARSMIKKYQSILTGVEPNHDMWHSVPIILWEPIYRSLKFQNVSLN